MEQSSTVPNRQSTKEKIKPIRFYFIQIVSCGKGSTIISDLEVKLKLSFSLKLVDK